jgi:hypothetical protein
MLKVLAAKDRVAETRANKPFLHTLQIKPAHCAGFFVGKLNA